MFHKNHVSSMLLICVLFLFPSCIKKYYELSPDEFPQGKDKEEKREVVEHEVKRVACYDQFSTVAIFDVLRLSDETRKACVEIDCEKKGKTEQEKSSILRRQLEENKHWTSFYVLADVRDKKHVSLTDANSVWSMFLEDKEGNTIKPINIKELDLEPEYQFIFGHRFDTFKRNYKVKFPVIHAQDYKLVFSSAKKCCFVPWGDGSLWNKKGELKKQKKNKKVSKKEKKKPVKKSKEKILKHEDYYWL